jgi:hypothetical protein
VESEACSPFPKRRMYFRKEYFWGLWDWGARKLWFLGVFDM